MMHPLRQWFAALLLACVFLLPVAGLAQEEQGGEGESPAASAELDTEQAQALLEATLAPVFEDYPEWEALARRAEEAAAAGRASNAALGELRAELASWREAFLERQSVNSARIATLRSQIAALGAPPEGVDEAAALAARRAALNTELQALRAPGVLAAEGFAEADGLISEIDGIIRDRQSAALLERVQSPLNPAGWGLAAEALLEGVTRLRTEVQTRWSSAVARGQLTDNTGGLALLLLAGLVLLARGRRWAGRFEGLIGARTRRGRGVWLFIISLGQLLLPLIGLSLISQALTESGLLGRRGMEIAAALPEIGFFPLLAHWLSGLLFYPSTEGREAPLPLPEDSRGSVVRSFVLLGYTHALERALSIFMSAIGFEAVPFSVLQFAAGVAVAIPLFRLGRALRIEPVEGDEDEAHRGFRMTLRRLLSRALIVVTLGGVLLGAVGYLGVIDRVVIPAAMTVYLLALLLVLQRLSLDIYTLVSRIEDGAETALTPVLIGFVLVLLSVPLLALIWGLQATDLAEIWTRFKEGFSIGETRISPTDFLTFLIIFVVGYTATRLLQGAMRTSILPRTKLDAGGRNAILAGIGYVGIFLAAIIAITTAGIDLSGLAIVAGALSVGIGFGLQNIVSNFVSGIILLIERPIAEGDWIEVNGQMGYVRDISVRSTRIETFDRTDVIVPNADLVSGQVTNWTRGNSVGRVIVPVGVAYGTDTEWVAGILLEIARDHPLVMLNPEPKVVFQGFGADSLDFEIRAILRDVNYVLQVKSEMNHAIAKRFAAEGIEIPFAQRDVWLRNPETLRGSGQDSGEDT